MTSSGPVSGMSLEEPFVAPSQIETKVVDAQLAATGQIFALVVPLAVIVGGFILIGAGRPVTGFAAIIGASSGLFLYRHHAPATRRGRPRSQRGHCAQDDAVTGRGRRTGTTPAYAWVSIFSGVLPVCPVSLADARSRWKTPLF